MSGTTISTTVTFGIVLGSPNFAGPLSLTATGKILPTAYGVTGLEVPTGVANPTITNHGTVAGGSGIALSQPNDVPAGDGGLGIDISASGVSLSNDGVIAGGSGGGDFYSYNATGNPAGGGGIAIEVTANSDVITNAGQIVGGEGGYDPTFGGAGGIAVKLQSGTLINSGHVTGGAGGVTGAAASVGGIGGDGVLAQSDAVIDNTGSIAGGTGGSGNAGSAGGEGVDLESGCTLVNSGVVTGGNGSSDNYGGGGAGGVGLWFDGGELTNTGTIQGGMGGTGGGLQTGSGGIGIYVTGGVLSNAGSVRGGEGGYGYFGNGGAAIKLQTGTLMNSGVVTGGDGNYSRDSYDLGAGGDGVVAISNAVIINTNIISGGYNVVQGGNGPAPITGAYGVRLESTGTVINSGIILGGVGSGSTDGDIGGTGGAGVSFNGGELDNSGTIQGGTGSGFGSTQGGQGGAGVHLHGGMLINSGTIEGGAGGLGYNDYGATGDAVEGNGIVVAEPGAVFDGSLAFTGILETVESAQTELVGVSSQIEGFVDVFFAGGAEFGAGKTIVLEGFAATSHSYVSGAGFELSDGSDTVTLGLTGSFSGGDFSVVVADGDTTITDATGSHNGPPILTKPATATVSAGKVSAVRGISLTETGDTRGEIFTVKLSDHSGLLSATGKGITGAGSTALTITGSLALVNADLAKLHDIDWTAAPDTITIAVTDSLGGKTAGSIAVTVNGSIGGGDLRMVLPGEAAEYLTVNNDGIVLITSGATASTDILNNAGLQGVLFGGTANGTSINDGGAQGVLGTARNTRINNGGVEIIGPAGISVDPTINSGGLEIILPGGTAGNSTIAAGGTELLAAGAHAAGMIDFSGSNGTLLIDGTTLPTTEISGFDLNGAAGDQIVLRDFAYVAGHDTATLGARNTLTLDLNGTIKTLYLDPSENYAGHGFSITTNSLDQVVVIDPLMGQACRSWGSWRRLPALRRQSPAMP